MEEMNYGEFLEKTKEKPDYSNIWPSPIRDAILKMLEEKPCSREEIAAAVYGKVDKKTESKIEGVTAKLRKAGVIIRRYANNEAYYGFASKIRQ